MPLEVFQRLLALAGNSKNHRRFGGVSTQGAEIELVRGGLDVMQNNAPQPLIGHFQNPGCRQHWHLPDENHGRLLEQQGELARFAYPGNLDLLDPVFLAVNPGNSRRNETMMLKQVEMAPGHLFKIMSMAKCTAYWAEVLFSSTCLNGQAKRMGRLVCIEQLGRDFSGVLQPKP